MCFFFFMQKTAYEMRISDWISDVCSSDLVRAVSLLTTDLSTRRLSAGYYSWVFGVWLELVDLATPASIQCSTPHGIHPTLYLNRFRGEPAISRFDWPFTPKHNSSDNFSTLTVSVLQCVLPHLQPVHKIEK